MCGICGIYDLRNQKRVQGSIIKKMTNALWHRGPDARNNYVNHNLALGFSRLSIIDLTSGMQPIFNENGSIVLVCNGEIFNYVELRQELIARNHQFKTKTDVEVIIHLYEENSVDFLDQLNGQFAFAIFDFKKQQLFCARDHVGIIPFFYTVADGFFIFASEIKAILEHPHVKKEVDLVGLDQLFTFPGLISPRTMFKDINSLGNGHYLIVKDTGNIESIEYWDLIYPEMNDINEKKSETNYIEELEELITQSIKLRLRADVPIGLYLSGGLDSSLIAIKAQALAPNIKRNSFSIDFAEKEMSESTYQRKIADLIQSLHKEMLFSYQDIGYRLNKAVYHSEHPLKESYNTAALALSEAAGKENIKVVLSGEGADEWFAGYPGYKFDKIRQMQDKQVSAGNLQQRELNKKIWGHENFNFETHLMAVQEIKKGTYSKNINELYHEIDCLNHKVVNKQRLVNRHILHVRSYLDYKLRLVGHLISDHGDRMAYANSVEVRYPFLDKNLIEFAAQVPPGLKLKEFQEKYILKKIAQRWLPREIIRREKFAFHAPGSPYLMKKNDEHIEDLLSYERIKQQNYFNPNTVEKLKKQYSCPDFRLNIPYEIDLLIAIITFGIFLEEFQMPPFHQG